MAASVNKVILIGHLGKDPVIRTLNSGDQVANFSVATSESWRDKRSGERQEKTEWHSVVIFNEHIVKVAENYLKKGSKVYLEGALQTRKWTDQNGVEKYSTEVVLQKFKGELTLLDSKPSDDDDDDRRGGGGGNNGGDRQRGSREKPRESYPADLDDEIPFIRNAWGLEP